MTSILYPTPKQVKEILAFQSEQGTDHVLLYLHYCFKLNHSAWIRYQNLNYPPLKSTMAPDSTKPNQATMSQRNLDQEVRDLISALTNRLSGIQRMHKSGHVSQDDDEHGVGVITLAGNNVGSTMRGDMEDKAPGWHQEHEDFATYVNSNFQGINNSIMLDGSYNTNDPGVHLDISEYLEDHNTRPRHGRKGKKIDAGSSHSKSEHETEENSG